MNQNIHLLSTTHTHVLEELRAIFNYIPIVLKRQVYFQCILPTVTYACVTCNLTTQQTFKLRTLQRVRARIIPNITWRDHKTAQYIGAKKNKVRDFMEMIIKLKWYWAALRSGRTRGHTRKGGDPAPI